MRASTTGLARKTGALLFVAAALVPVVALVGNASAQRDGGSATVRRDAGVTVRRDSGVTVRRDAGVSLARDAASPTRRDAAAPPSAGTGGLSDAGRPGNLALSVAGTNAPLIPLAQTCPGGMRLVDGEYCPNVDQRCMRWLDPDEQMRCAEFEPTRCSGRRRHISVCMDEYEFPNRRGAYPQVMVSWYAARRTCESRGARLCTMAEWTFACEGEEMRPYPYGYTRDATACNVDHQTVRPDRARLGNPATSADESSRLYEAAPSGQYEGCVTSFGIHDMTGNADEWVRNETSVPYQSALKGGWWGPIRGRCRPATISHNEGFVYYQIGFRCCADPTTGSAPPTP